MEADPFRFAFEPDAPPDGHDGWGRGALHLAGLPYWFGDAANGGLFRWTWVDLLEFLGENWLALCVEQQYPYAWLAREAAHPGQIWEVAERRWALQGGDEDKLFAEEEAVLAFIARHDLARAWKGLNLPQLLWLRSGEHVWLVPEHDKPLLLSFRAALAELEDIGNRLAAAMEGSANPRILQALAFWHGKTQIRDTAAYVALATGWSAQAVHLLQGTLAANDYWFDGTDAVCAYRETPVLAAARMLRFTLGAEDTAILLERIRTLPSRPSDELDAYSTACQRRLEEADSPHPWEQGYVAANWLRQHLGLTSEQPCDPRAILDCWGVAVQHADLLSDQIDALACWGGRGPAVLINDRPGARTSTANRLRTTLAHEIAHLLVDTRGALPVAEVLGGSVDPFVEQRARAFAAELLLPREAARQVYRTARTLPEALNRLSRRYRVSKQVAAYQLRNSGCALQAQDEATLDASLAQYQTTPPALLHGR